MAYKLQKLQQLLKSHDWSDCTFIVENEKVPAHKLILSYNSPVFEMMLYGEMASSEIYITDIKVKDFKIALEFLYTDQLKIESVAQAWNLIYIGKKYFLNSLVDLCVEYINNNLNLKDLLMSYEMSQIYEQDRLKNACFRDILLNAKEILELNDYHVKVDTLWDILNELDYSNIPDNNDETVIVYVLNWIEDECELQNMQISQENIHNVANSNGLMKFIRNKYENKKNNNNNSKAATRNDSTKFRFRLVYKISKKILFIRPFSIATMFNVDKACFISGVSVLTQHHSSTANSDKYFGGINVKIMSVNSNEIIGESELAKQHFQYDDSVAIQFKDVFIVSPKVLYQIIVTYYNQSNSSHEGEILLNFFSSKLCGYNNTNFEFFDEFDGSVVNGFASYPA